MKITFLCVLGIIALGLSVATPALAQSRRVLLVGSNAAPPGLSPLRYAQSDAQKMHDVLVELGGVNEGEATVLLDPTPEELRNALGVLRSQVSSAQQLFFYYSGHANESSLLLGKATFPVAEVREFLKDDQSQVRVAILDSCQSGAITQAKGGKMHPGVDVRWEAQSMVEGAILITSSTAEEASVERDDLGGSLFSHYFVSGLRGAADKNQDRKVTLEEAFGYSYEHTLSRSTESRTGLQHPMYEYRIVGQRQLVMSWLEVESFISFDEMAAGSYVVFDRFRSQVVAELNKKPGDQRRLWLPPGDYYIKKRLPTAVLVQKVGLAKGDVHRVRDYEMHTVPYEEDITKGHRSEVFHPTWKYGAAYIENTAHTLRRGEISVGLQRAQLGLNDDVTFSTDIGNMLLTASPSLMTKFRLFHTDQLVWSLSTGYLLSYFGRVWGEEERSYMQLRAGTTLSWVIGPSLTVSVLANWALESGPSIDGMEWETQLGSGGGSITWAIGESDLIQVSAEQHYTFLAPEEKNVQGTGDWGGALVYAHSFGSMRVAVGLKREGIGTEKLLWGNREITPSFDIWWRW